MTLDFLVFAQGGSGSPGSPASDLGVWFPPIWTMCLGVLLGLAVVTVIYGIVAVISRPGGKLIEELWLEGLLQPVFYASLVPAGFALAAFPWAPVKAVLSPATLLWLEGLVMLGWAAGLSVALFGLVLLAFVLLRSIWPQLGGEMTSLIATVACACGCFGSAIALSIPMNLESNATLADTLLMLGTARFFVVLFLLAMTLRIGFPKVAAVAQTTCKEGMGHPLFWVCISIATFWMLVAIWLPYNTFGEDIIVLKTQGLELLTFVAILLAVATSSVSVSQELEGRTALTVLSKPIGRVQFILGKFFGVAGPVMMVFLILGFVLLCTTSFKTVYDGQEAGTANLTHENCRTEMLTVVPGLALSFIAAMVIAAISVAVSTRLPLLANLSICFVIYVVGSLAPAVVASSVDLFEPVQFMGQLIAVVLPVFEHLKIPAAYARHQAAPVYFVLNAAFYGLCYCVFMLLLALVLFEDRDLA